MTVHFFTRDRRLSLRLSSRIIHFGPNHCLFELIGTVHFRLHSNPARPHSSFFFIGHLRVVKSRACQAWSEIGHVTYIKLKGPSIEYLSVSSKVSLTTVFLKNRFYGLKMDKKSKISEKRIGINRNKLQGIYA